MRKHKIIFPRIIQKVVILICIFCVCTTNVFSQEFKIKKLLLCDSCEQNLSFRFETTSFIKNNEYSGLYASGFTGIGFYLKPVFEYYLTKNTKVTTGIFLLKYSGVKTFSESIPIFSVQQKLFKGLDFVLGSIYGALNHEIEEPLFRFDRYYQNNVEYGAQFLYYSDFVESDIWVNWEKFIFKDDPFQEEIEAGTTSTFKIMSKKFKVYAPLQTLIYHKGGQIDTSPDPAFSIFNGVAGLRFEYHTNKKNVFAFEPQFFLYQGLGLPEKNVNSQRFNSGNALYLKFRYRNKYFNSMVGYWGGEKFIAPKGEYLFLSISESDKAFYEVKRQVATAKLEKRYILSKAIQIELMTDVYFDILNNDFSFSFGLYFFIDESFSMGRIFPQK